MILAGIVLYVLWLVFMPVVYRAIMNRSYWIEPDLADYTLWFIPPVFLFLLSIVLIVEIVKRLGGWQDRMGERLLQKWDKAEAKPEDSLLKASEENI